MEAHMLSHCSNGACLISFPKASSAATSSRKTRSHCSLSWRGAKLKQSRLRSSVSVQCVISRAKKEEVVEKVKQQLENCYLIAAIRYQGLTVKQFEEIRNALPDSSKLVVAKNRLVGKAIEGTSWEALKPCMKGMNAYLFVHSEEIPQALKPYREFQKQNKLEENDYLGAVFEGRFYPSDEFKALETMPSRDELYSKILGSLQGPAIGLVSTLQAPARDLVFTLKAFVQKLEAGEGGSSS